MRKRSITHVAKTVFWYALYFLPVLAYLIFLFTNPLPEEGPLGVTSADEYGKREVLTIKPSADTSSGHVSELGSYFENRDFYPFYLKLRTLNINVSEYSYFPVTAALLGSSLPSSVTWPGGSPVMYLDPTTYKLAEDLTIELPLGFTKSASGMDLYVYDPSSSNFKPVVNAMLLLLGADRFSSNITYVSNSVTDISYDFSFEEFVESMGFEFATENFIVTTLEDMFGAQGVMPLFNDTAPFIIFGWYICVFIVHLMVDFLMFIPKFAHKWMEDFVGD